MTKLRAPLSFADAMTRVAGTIGWDAAATLVGKSDRTVRSWSEPDRAAVPSVADALALDAAHRLAGGEGAPFLDVFAHLLDVQVAQAAACYHALTADAALVAREAGEAVAAALAIAQPGARPHAIHRAQAEVDQAERALRTLGRRLNSFLQDGGSPGSGNDGGAQ